MPTRRLPALISILAASSLLTIEAGAQSPKIQHGKASYMTYTSGKTASGAPYKPHAFTAAHRTLPFGTRVNVTDLRSGKSVLVTVNDRGPFIRGRLIDLSMGAARVLGMPGRGIVQVRSEVVGQRA